MTYQSWQKDPPKYQYGFQGQEYQEETGWHQYKWRNADPALGRFFNIDPLADKYVYNSTYAFSENQVTAFVELEGLEKAKPKDPGRFNFMSGPEDRFLAINQKERLRGQITNEEFTSALNARAVMGAIGGVISFGGMASLPYLAEASAFAANPVNTPAIMGGVGFVGNMLDPDPNADWAPGVPLDDAGNLLGAGLRKLLNSSSSNLILGKADVIGRYANDIDNSFSMFKPGFGMGVPSFLTPSNQITKALYQTIDEGGQIFFDLKNVSIDAAKKGFKNFDEADAARNITEWELSKILRDSDLFKNTIFHIDGVEKKATDLGLELINE